MYLQGLIERFVSDDIQLQISGLYATQVFCYEKQFPKGLFWDRLVIHKKNLEDLVGFVMQ